MTSDEQIIDTVARAIHAVEGHSDWDGNLHEENTAWGTGKAVRRAEARAAVAAAYAALSTAGWRLVPVDPTDEQQSAGDNAMRHKIMSGLGRLLTLSDGYRAMISAAPPPPGIEIAAASRAGARETPYTGEDGA